MKKTKNGRLFEGLVKRHPDGFGFFIPDENNFPDVYIPHGNMGSALTNDRVQVLVHKKNKAGHSLYFGSIQSILKRDKEFATGIFEKKGNHFFLKNHNLSYEWEIPVYNPKKIPIKKGEYIRVRLHFDTKKNSFKGDVEENFGFINFSAADDRKRIMVEQGISLTFPEEVLKEAERLPKEVLKRDFSNRKDLRDKAFVTIDGATAKDFDDAIFVEKHPKFYRLYVAIADVSYYVKEDSLLDEEAFQRGNSSYFPGFCSPMLPEKLSNDLCSLKPDLPRLVMAQEIDFDFQGEKLKSKIYPSVIQSKQRLTYGEVQDHFDSSNSSIPNDIISSLKEAKSLSQILFQKHLKEQALNLDIPETILLVNNQGEPLDILEEKRLFSHIMIEMFMLAANKEVSAFLEKKQIPLIYRIHPSPEVEKLKSLQKFSKILGFSKPFQKRKNLIYFLNKYKNHKRTPLIHKLVLRSLSQAHYSAFNTGHYGLNFSSYTHFTSPIRRYSDLMVHRMLKQALSKKPKSLLSQKEIESRARFISQKEQNSVKAERQIKDIKKARFLKKYIGHNFSGYVSSISSFGLFINLKQFDIEGLVRFRDLKGFWEADELQLSAFNRRTAYRIQFGDEVQVTLIASNITTGNIDLKLTSHKGRNF